jgi:3-ketosteroid 9alpha-monooxygenase subunit B
MEKESESWSYHSLRVLRVIDETPDARSLVLEVPEGLSATFDYCAGQFLTFRVRVAGERLVRCYSLASSPDTDCEHKVTVKRVAGGRVSNWLNDSVGVGDSLEVLKPAGVFCLRERETPLLLFAGGSGITPVISIVKSALARTRRSLRLVYANRDATSVIFRDELERLAAAHADRFELVHRFDDVQGFVDAGLVREQAAGRLDADVYVCGPGPFMDVVEEALGALGVAPERIFIERFVSPQSATPSASAAPSLARAAALATVVLDGRTSEVPCAEGETVLVASRRAGLEPPFACEEGYCGCCMARVTEGRVEMNLNDGGVDAGQIAAGWVLTCQGVPVTARVRVEYPD